MTDSADSQTVDLTQAYPAADWLRRRHPWLDELVRRIADRKEDWLDELLGAVLEEIDGNAAWGRYERAHPRPQDRDDDDAFYAWEAAGPKATPRAQSFGVMSSGERNVVRLVATLANVFETDYVDGERRTIQKRVPWTVHDIGGWDERGEAIFRDWLRIVEAHGIWSS